MGSRSLKARLRGISGAAPSASRLVGFAGILLAPAFLVAGCVVSTDARPTAWSYVSAAVIEPNCATASCHSQAVAAGGIDLSTAARGYKSLTGLWVWIVDPMGTADQGCQTVEGTTVCQRENRSLVIPFDPAQSRLTLMLRGRGAPRMPPDQPLPEADIRLVEQWILDGAVDDRAQPVDDASAVPVATPITIGSDAASPP